MNYGIVFKYDSTTQTVTLVSGSPVYKNSVVTHTMTLLADLVLGNIVTATFYLGQTAVTQGLTMKKTVDVAEWTLPLPDIVVGTAGSYTVAFAILQPIVNAGVTTYRVLTTGNQTFTIITSVAQQAVNTVTPTEAENLQSQIDALDQTVSNEETRLTTLIENIQPFIGANGNWYVYNKATNTMVDSGVKASGQKLVSLVKTSTVGLVDTWTFTFDDGATETFTVTNGADGKAATITVGTTTTGLPCTNASVTNVGTELSAIFNFAIPQGAKGDTGNGIVSITLTSTIGTAKTYTILYTDGNTSTFTVMDGKSFYIAKTYSSIAQMNADYNNPAVAIGDFVLIASTVSDPDNAKMYVKGETTYDYVTDLSGATGIQGVGVSSILKTATSGLVDTYTITYTDNSTSTFEVTNGRGISTISKTATVGVVDTYTITYNDGTISTFTVTNGIDGTGSGNLSVSNTTVDNTKKYLIANAVKSGTEVNSELQELVIDGTPTNGSNNPVSSGGVYTSENAINGNIGTLQGKVTTLESTTATHTSQISTINNQITGINNTLPTLQVKNLNFSNVVVAIGGFVADTTYADFPFRASVTLAGVLATMIPTVNFNLADATSGIYAPICTTYDGGVYLYATKANTVAVTIPTIVLQRTV